MASVASAAGRRRRSSRAKCRRWRRRVSIDPSCSSGGSSEYAACCNTRPWASVGQSIEHSGQTQQLLRQQSTTFFVIESNLVWLFFHSFQDYIPQRVLFEGYSPPSDFKFELGFYLKTVQGLHITQEFVGRLGSGPHSEGCPASELRTMWPDWAALCAP